MADPDALAFSTGIPALDGVLRGLVRGDNVVWQLEELDDYVHFLLPFCRNANREGKPLIYFRFAQHRHLLPEDVAARCVELDAQAGFEPFIAAIFSVIEEAGPGACYVFDSLSDLSVDWYSDRMLGNFFMLACPYLFIFDTIAYFMLSKHQHTPFAVEAIHQTAQVVLDVFRSGPELYLLPIKVQNVHAPDRHSASMYTLHSGADDAFTPVTKSMVVARILGHAPQPWLDFNIDRRDIWTETFLEAQKMNEEIYRNRRIPGRVDSLKSQLIRMILTREEALFALCHRYLSMEDLIAVGKRMVGTGLVGGKSTGMLLARAILHAADPAWDDMLETHDSFFVGSDVYYTYIITNGCWWDRRQLRGDDLDLSRTDDIRARILAGRFPEDIVEQFREMLNYFGQSPIIVRSSSILEDAYGNAFSGKYESVFCANQGTPDQRLRNFLDAVRTVYASTMSREALAYRAHRGLLDQDEQMALLVQRVSGEVQGHLYFPHLAGVGYSFNPFVWNPRIEAAAGVLRLVCGLGTHAVDRGGDDYTRIVALNEPLLRPESSGDALARYSQKQVDVLDLAANRHATLPFAEIAQDAPALPLDLIAPRNQEIEERARELGRPGFFSRMLTFDPILAGGEFLPRLRAMLATLEAAYAYPVDIEFAVNFLDDKDFRINLLQCRPFQISRDLRRIETIGEIPDADVVLRSTGPILGQSLATAVDHLIYIVPERYSALTSSDRFAVAHLIGELTATLAKDHAGVVMLVGPGRWGTSMPELGIPATFSEIRHAAILCELAIMHEGLSPDVSLGTHFFNDLVETDILYLAVEPIHPGTAYRPERLLAAPNRLAELHPDAAPRWADTVRVITQPLSLHADTFQQRGVLFVTHENGSPSPTRTPAP
jgi:hypothetical protein